MFAGPSRSWTEVIGIRSNRGRLTQPLLRVDGALQPRLEELRADRERHGAAHEEEREGEHEIERADLLVVGRRDPSQEPELARA